MFTRFIFVVIYSLFLLCVPIMVACSGEQQQNTQNQTKSMPAASLAGKSFAIELWENDQSAGPDTLVFTENSCKSNQCLQYGFGESSYSVTPEGGGLRWSSTVESPTEGKIYWSGLITGDKIKGTMVWEKEGQATINYKFNGSKL